MHLSPWTLPAPLPGSRSLKPLSSARTGLTRLRNGELELTIKHEVVRGVNHNVEEVGNLECFLPGLYGQWLAGHSAASRASGAARSAGIAATGGHL